MTIPVKVEVKRLPHGAGLPLPAYATSGAAGMDVVSAEEVTIAPGARHAVATGLALLATILSGHVGDVRDRGRTAPAESSRGDMMRGGLILLVTIACSGLIYQTTSFAMPKLFEQRPSTQKWRRTSASWRSTPSATQSATPYVAVSTPCSSSVRPAPN